MSKQKELDLKAETFCQAYTCIGSDTFDHVGKSVLAAGYAEGNKNQGTKLLKDPAVKARIMELHKDHCNREFVTEGSVLANIQHDRALARSKGDVSTAVRCDELEGKFLALFSDRYSLTAQAQELPELSEADREELRQMAQMAIMKRLQTGQDEADTPQTGIRQ